MQISYLRRFGRQNWAYIALLIATCARVVIFRVAYHHGRGDIRIHTPHWIHQWQQRFLNTSAIYDETGLLQGIFLGFAKSIPRPILDVFQQGGLTHIVAASGFNCWIVGALFLGVSQLLMPDRLLSPQKRRTFQMICQALGALLFWSWTEQSPPVTRAALMMLMRCGLYIAGLRVSFSRLLSIQYLFSLCIWPVLFRMASFHLTYFCLFGLVGANFLFSYLVGNRKASWKLQILRYFVTTSGACIGVAPITWIFFGEVNATSLLTNWLAVAPVTFLIMPLGLIQMMLLITDDVRVGSIACAVAFLNAEICKTYYKILHFWIGMIPHLLYAPYHY